MPKDFFVGNVSMKSCLLDGMLRFLKHAPALEIFWPKVWIFRQFSLLGERGGGGLGCDNLCHRNKGVVNSPRFRPNFRKLRVK